MLSIVRFLLWCFLFFFFKQKTAYEMRISDWSSDVCSSDLARSSRRGSMQKVTAFMGRDPSVPTLYTRPIARNLARRSSRSAAAPSPSSSPSAPAIASPSAPIAAEGRSEEHTSELQSLLRTYSAVFCLKKKSTQTKDETTNTIK